MVLSSAAYSAGIPTAASEDAAAAFALHLRISRREDFRRIEPGVLKCRLMESSPKDTEPEFPGLDVDTMITCMATGWKPPDARYSILDTGYWILDAGCSSSIENRVFD
jgi:hypothetical protein